MNSSKNLSASDFRMSSEQPVLFISLSILIVLMLFILAIQPWILLGIIIYSIIAVKIRQKQFMGSMVRVSSNNFPNIQKIAMATAKNLSMSSPDIFIIQNPIINAFATGVLGKKSVVLYSSLVESMSDDELMYVIGHELTHIKCGHTSWSVVTNSVNQIRIPIVSSIMGYIFLFWNRISEYSADRGGLIACRDLNSTTSALIKIAVGEQLSKDVDIKEFLKQTIEGGRLTKLSEILLTHPYINNRVKMLSDFINSNQYKNICKGNFEDRNNETVKLLKRWKTDLKGKDIKVKVDVLTKKLENLFNDVVVKANREPPTLQNYLYIYFYIGSN
jgi:Zn-dependent protease with chaperone function